MNYYGIMGYDKNNLNNYKMFSFKSEMELENIPKRLIRRTLEPTLKSLGFTHLDYYNMGPYSLESLKEIYRINEEDIMEIRKTDMLRHKSYNWGTVRHMDSEEYDWFNKINSSLPGKKYRLLFTNDSNCGRVILEGGSFTPFGFARRVKGGFIVAKYSQYDKYCDDGSVLRDVEDK